MVGNLKPCIVQTLERTRLPSFLKGGNGLRRVRTIERRLEPHSKGNKIEKRNFKSELFVTGDGENKTDHPYRGGLW